MSYANDKTAASFPWFSRNGDEFLSEQMVSGIQTRLAALNRSLIFHTVSITQNQHKIQLYVRQIHNPYTYNNHDCRCRFGIYRSIAIRRYCGEVHKLRRKLYRLAAEFGFIEQ